MTDPRPRSLRPTAVPGNHLVARGAAVVLWATLGGCSGDTGSGDPNVGAGDPESEAETSSETTPEDTADLGDTTPDTAADVADAPPEDASEETPEETSGDAAEDPSGDTADAPEETSEDTDTADTDTADTDTADTDTVEPGARPNLLIVIADDVSARELGAWGAADSPTPNLDALGARSVLYSAAWSNPVCSPTRAGVYTGRHAFRHGVGAVVPPGARVSRPGVLSPDETTLAERLGEAGYATALVGKWHLGTNEDQGGLCAPIEVGGFGFYAGSSDAIFNNYGEWTRTVGTASGGAEGACDSAISTVYPTTDVVDSALSFIAGTTAPWLVVAAFNAPHAPFHAPPADLSGDPTLTAGDCTGNGRRRCFLAALRALDAEVGRLVAGLPDPANTAIIFLGDNGDPGQVVAAPHTSDHAKDTLYEGGLLVPLLVLAPGESPRVVATPVQTLDVYATALELAGLDAAPPGGPVVDSQSLLGEPRATAWSEQFEGGDPTSGGWTLRDARHKLIVWADGTRALYDLTTDPLETTDLASTEPATAAALEAEGRALRGF